MYMRRSGVALRAALRRAFATARELVTTSPNTRREEPAARLTCDRARVAAVTVFLARPERVGEGIPRAVKDLFNTAGLRTTYGSILLPTTCPTALPRRSPGSRRGYVNIGKTNLSGAA
jgi:Asp-tRNA(Asn)/Glu-tRNA(Gln) amidotransferase A subunit family amidase